MLFPNIPPRAWFSVLALGCCGLVAAGLGLQAQLHLAACPLCIFQRVLYLTLGLLALGGFIFPCAKSVWAALISAVAALGVGVAGYQTWMQAFPQFAHECSYTDPDLIERLVDWLGMQLPALFLATGFCATRDWEFLGLSMANWSLLVFVGIAVGIFLIFLRRR